MGMEGYSWYVARKAMGNPKFSEMIDDVVESKDSDTVVVFVEDSGALIGLSIAFIGNVATMLTENPIYDAVSSVIIGALLFVMAFFLANEMRKLMVGERIDSLSLSYVRMILISHPSVKTIGKMKSMQLGGRSSILMIDADFVDTLHDSDLDRIIPEITAKIRDKVPHLEHISIQPRKLS